MVAVIPPSRPAAPRSSFVAGPLLALAALAVLTGCGPDKDYDRAINPAPTLVATTVATSEPSPSSTDAPTTSEAPATTEAPTTSEEPTTAVATTLTLSTDGLGAVPFGTPTDAALATLSGILGTPAGDSGWVEARTSSFGVCPGREVRGVRFGPLQVLFGDLDGDSTQFFTYLYATSLLPAGETPGPAAGLVTAEGLGLGTSVAELQKIYPDAVVSSDIYGPTFSTSSAGGLVGTLSAESADGVVTSIIGGSFCGD